MISRRKYAPQLSRFFPRPSALVILIDFNFMVLFTRRVDDIINMRRLLINQLINRPRRP